MVFPEAFPTTEERKRVATPLLPPEDIRFDPSPTAFFVCNRCLENLCIVDIISLLTANVGAKLRKRKQERKESICQSNVFQWINEREDTTHFLPNYLFYGKYLPTNTV